MRVLTMRSGPLVWGLRLMALLPPLAVVIALVQALSELGGAGASGLGVLGGLAPAAAGSAGVTVLALLLVVPVGLGGALHLAELARSARRWVRLVLEALSGAPAIVLGWAVVTGWGPAQSGAQRTVLAAVALTLCGLGPFTLDCYGLVARVPRRVRHGCLALGASRQGTLLTVILPSIWPDLCSLTFRLAALLLGQAVVLAVVLGLPTSPAAQGVQLLPLEALGGLQAGADPAVAPAAMLMLVGLQVLTLILGHGARRRVRRREQ